MQIMLRRGARRQVATAEAISMSRATSRNHQPTCLVGPLPLSHQLGPGRLGYKTHDFKVAVCMKLTSFEGLEFGVRGAI